MKTISQSNAIDIAKKVKILIRRDGKIYVGEIPYHAGRSIFPYICSKKIPKDFEEVTDFETRYVEEKRKRDLKVYFDKKLFLEDVISQLPVNVQDSIDVIEISAGAMTKSHYGTHYEYVRVYREKSHPSYNNLSIEQAKELYNHISVFVHFKGNVYLLNKNISDNDFIGNSIETLCTLNGEIVQKIDLPRFYVNENGVKITLDESFSGRLLYEQKLLHKMSYFYDAFDGEDETIYGIPLFNVFSQIHLEKLKKIKYIFINDSPTDYIDLNAHLNLSEAADDYAVYNCEYYIEE